MKKTLIILVLLFTFFSFSSQSKEVLLTCECSNVERYYYKENDEGVSDLVPSQELFQKISLTNPQKISCDKVQKPENTFTINIKKEKILQKFNHLTLKEYTIRNFVISEISDNKLIAHRVEKDGVLRREHFLNVILNINPKNGNLIRNGNIIEESETTHTHDDDSSYSHFTSKHYYNCMAKKKSLWDKILGKKRPIKGIDIKIF